MRDDIRLEEWRIENESPYWFDDFHETIFFTGNGRIGMRGHLPCGCPNRPTKAGLYMAGVFAQIKDGITDIVHLPTPVHETVYMNGIKLEPQGSVRRELDLLTGVFTARYTLSSADGRVEVEHRRFAHLANPGCIVQRSVYQPADDMRLEIHSGVSLAARNSPVPDDQVKRNDEMISLIREKPPVFSADGFTVRLSTAGTRLTVTEVCRLRAEGFVRTGESYVPEKTAEMHLAVNTGSGLAYTIDKLCFIKTSRDRDPRIAEPEEEWTFEAMLMDHALAWRRRWQQIEPCSMPAPRMETALRYAAAMLVMNGPAGDDTVSIGARGLNHARYKGCYFWDTDFFLMPFYLHTHPQTAGNLIKYRLKNLPAARLHAQRTSAKGARYPWMAAFDGSEQCESWDIGLAEVHVTADVVFAVDQYMTKTGDRSLYPLAAEVYIETARFWQDRYTRDASGAVRLLFVKGPDEYCGITSNNLFTNLLVKRNLRLAIEAAVFFKKLPDKYESLGITEREVEDWAALMRDIVLPRNPQTGQLQQDDTFHLLEPIALSALKNDDEASYHRLSFDRLQRYRVTKQADLLLVMTRCPEDFSQAEKLQAWREYEPLCLHDSTLSFASHALFAAQNGYLDSAQHYLEKALFLDLQDIMGNTGEEGLHMACCAEAWQAAMRLYQPDRITPCN